MSVIFVDHNNEGFSKKLDTCAHRSPNQIEGEVNACCGNKKKIFSYKCEKRNIYPLSVVICAQCSEYKEKL